MAIIPRDLRVQFGYGDRSISDRVVVDGRKWGDVMVDIEYLLAAVMQKKVDEQT